MLLSGGVLASGCPTYKSSANSAKDTTATRAWYVGPRTKLDAADEDTFTLLDFTVDGVARKIHRSSKRGSQTYSVSFGDDAMQTTEPVTVAYTYRTLISADERLLQLRVDQPTKGLNVELDYGDTDIDHVNVLDFIASSNRTTISRSPADLPGKTVSISFDEWVSRGAVSRSSGAVTKGRPCLAAEVRNEVPRASA